MIEKQFDGTYEISCDVCGAETEEMFETFQDAVDWKKTHRDEWISRKSADGTWYDVCPECRD